METAIVNDISIAYDRRGSGTPLVLLHGYPLDHHIWDTMAPMLESSFELIVPDLRGFGRSQVVEATYTCGDMAADVAGLLDVLKLEKAAIAGHSMGGYVALAFARAFPGRLLGLGLVSTQAPADSPERREGRYASARQVADEGVGWVAQAMPEKLSPDPGVQAAVAGMILEQPPIGLIGALKAMAERGDSTDLLPGLKVPTVIVHGDADVLIPIERAREMRSAAPQARLAVIAGAGHLPMMEFPAATAEALKEII